MSGKRLGPGVWERADWTQPDSILAQLLGVSHSAVHSQRRARGLPTPARARPVVEQPLVLASDAIHVVAGKRIRIARLGLGWTLERLGLDVGKASKMSAWSPSAVCSTERGGGSRGLTLDSLGAFARVLGLTPSDLLRRDETALLGRPRQRPGYVASLPSDLRGVVGDNIRRWRDSVGMTPTEMAAAVNRPGSWNATYIVRVERGLSGTEGRGLTIEWLGKFADALGVPASNLVRLPRQQSRMTVA